MFQGRPACMQNMSRLILKVKPKIENIEYKVNASYETSRSRHFKLEKLISKQYTMKNSLNSEIELSNINCIVASRFHQHVCINSFEGQLPIIQRKLRIVIKRTIEFLSAQETFSDKTRVYKKLINVNFNLHFPLLILLRSSFQYPTKVNSYNFKTYLDLDSEFYTFTFSRSWKRTLRGRLEYWGVGSWHGTCTCFCMVSGDCFCMMSADWVWAGDVGLMIDCISNSSMCLVRGTGIGFMLLRIGSWILEARGLRHGLTGGGVEGGGFQIGVSCSNCNNGLKMVFQKSQPAQPKKKVDIKLLASRSNMEIFTSNFMYPLQWFTVYTFKDMEHPCHIILMMFPQMNSLLALCILIAPVSPMLESRLTSYSDIVWRHSAHPINKKSCCD